MRAVFVNHCHPDTPHVCAVRMRAFSEVMASRGHRIVLLTATLRDSDPGADPRLLPESLATHDWSRPFRLACRPLDARYSSALQRHRLQRFVSKPLVLWCYLAKGGVFWTWAEASRPFWPILARHFGPDIVWATFGNADALNIARGIAGASRCPWVMDVKDPWDAFVPPGLRAVIARRYRDAAAVTALSEGHRDAVAHRLSIHAEVVRSGFDDACLAAPTEERDGAVRLVLSGSTYSRDDLARLTGALGDWLARYGEPSPGRPTLIYAGPDHAAVAALAAPLAGRCTLDIRPWIAAADLDRMCRSATANLYIKGRATPFHHKLIELLAAGRPIICTPPESAEAVRIAAETGVPLYSCADRASLADAFAAVVRCGAAKVDREALRRYTWAAQADILERVLAGILARSGSS